MNSFPELSKKPSDISFSNVEDPTLQQAGFLIRSGRIPILREYTLSYPVITEEDKELLEQFEEDNLGESFNWTHPISLTEYEAIFTDQLTFTIVEGTSYYSTTINLVIRM